MYNHNRTVLIAVVRIQHCNNNQYNIPNVEHHNIDDEIGPRFNNLTKDAHNICGRLMHLHR